MAIKNAVEVMSAHISVASIAHHIPFTPNSAGSRNTNAIWYTNDLKNESIAETSPLFSAVKKPDE